MDQGDIFPVPLYPTSRACHPFSESVGVARTLLNKLTEDGLVVPAFYSEFCGSELVSIAKPAVTQLYSDLRVKWELVNVAVLVAVSYTHLTLPTILLV